MVRRRLAAGTLVLAAIFAWTGRADGRRVIDPSQTRAAQDTTPIFVCGEDEKVPPIARHWTNAVLAGDGRLYSPCPGGNHTPDHREVREALVIGEGRSWVDTELRWRAAQAQARNSTRPRVFPVIGGGNPPRAGSFEFVLSQVDGLGGLIYTSTVTPSCAGEVQIFGDATNLRRWQPGRLFRMLTESTGYGVFRDGNEPLPTEPELSLSRQRIAREGAYAIGVLLSRPGQDANLVAAATKELRGCFTAFNFHLNRSDGELAGLFLEDLGLANYGSEAQIAEAENYLTQESHGGVLKILGAVKGLEGLIRQHPQREIGHTTRIRLRQLVMQGVGTVQPLALDHDARIRRLAFLALQAARDRDSSTLRHAMTDRDWQMRRLVAGSLSLSDPQMAAFAEGLAGDSAFQVRYELLSPISRHVAQTRDCTPLVTRFQDPSPIVVMRAIDLLVPNCNDPEEPTARLIAFADRLATHDEENWHVPSRALATLARIAPAEARSRLALAVKHSAWQVRAAAAAMTVALADQNAAATLARDSEPNVQTAALDALLRLRSPAVVPRAIAALSNVDYQLVRMAASALKGLPESAKNDASNALLAALNRVTAEEADTSRDSRIAILERLAETLTFSRSSELLPFVGDYDDEVRTAASKAFAALTQTSPPPVASRRRYPFQPTAAALLSLPSQASIQLQEGTVTLRLLPDVAPVTVARFAALAAQGYYSGLTFHRIVPNFVVQGGSPGANDYAGVRRFMRTEVGPQGVHVRGAVGMSSRGADAGDGQFFIDLVDLPHLDREYTVFAYVTQGMEFVDRLLEGAKIVTVSVK